MTKSIYTVYSINCITISTTEDVFEEFDDLIIIETPYFGIKMPKWIAEEMAERIHMEIERRDTSQKSKDEQRKFTETL